MTRFHLASVLSCALVLGGCGAVSAAGGSNHGPAAVTTLDPEPGNFFTTVTVTLTATPAADIVLTTDGSDPKTSATRQVSASPATVTLTETTNLSFYSKTAAGAEEAVRTVTYTRIHYIAGTVVVGSSVVGQAVTLVVTNGSQGMPDTIALGSPSQEGPIPFEVDNYDVGTYSVGAAAIPSQGLPVASEVVTCTITADHPSCTGITLYLGAIKPGSGTLQGTVTFGTATPGKILAVAPVDPTTLTSGGFGLDPSSMFYTLTTTELRYPYSKSGIAPGNYIPICVVTDMTAAQPGSGPLNLLFKLIPPVQIAEGATVTRDFAYGASSIQGNLTLTLSKPLPEGAAINAVVAAKNGLTDVQGLMIPTTVSVDASDATKYAGTFTATGLRDNQSFQFKAFATADGSDPTSDVLTWVLNPLSGGDKAATVSGPTNQVDLTLAVTVP